MGSAFEISAVSGGGITQDQLTTTSGHIVAQIPSLSGYATQSWANTTFIDNTEMTTISGDLVARGNIRYLKYTIDGGGSTIATGAQPFTTLPYAGTINGWWVTADTSTSTTLDVWKHVWGTAPAVGDKVSASAPITLSTAQFATSSSLPTWGTTVTGMDHMAFNVATNNNAKRLEIIIKMTVN
jgi:hypothetical protein